MAKRTKKAVSEVKQEEVKAEEIVMSPLPDVEPEVVKEEVKVEEPKKEEPKAEIKETPKAPKKYYAFCRISGGLIVDIYNDLGDKTKKILKSGNSSVLAADGTRTFQLRPSDFGITELTEEEAKQVKAALQPTKAWKKGFIFIVDNEAEGKILAQEQVVKYPKQGTEQLGAEEAKEVSKFSE